MGTFTFTPRISFPQTVPGLMAGGLAALLLLPGTIILLFLDAPELQEWSHLIRWSWVMLGATFLLVALDSHLALVTAVTQTVLLGMFEDRTGYFGSWVYLGPSLAMVILLALAVWRERRLPTGSLQPLAFAAVRLLGLAGFLCGWPLGVGVLLAGAIGRFWPRATQCLVIALIVVSSVDALRTVVGGDVGDAVQSLLAIGVLAVMLVLIPFGKDERDHPLLPGDR